MGQWVSWLRALPVACSTVEVFVFFYFMRGKLFSGFFKDFSYAPMIENPFSDWLTEPTPMSKKLFALTALS